MTAALEELLLGTDTWLLRVMSWQQSVHGVNKAGSDDYPIGEHRLDLKCRMERGLLQGDLLVGEDPTENLASLDFTIQLRGAQKIFSALEGKHTTEDDVKSTGALVYDPAIPAENLTGLSARNIEESKTGSVRGWAFFDDPALWEIARSLPMLSAREVYLSLTIRAAASSKPGLLVYEKQGYGATTYRWSGQHGLVVQDVALMNRKAQTPVFESPAEPEQAPGMEVSTAIDRATETLNKSIVRMGIYILILLGAILLELWRLH